VKEIFSIVRLSNARRDVDLAGSVSSTFNVPAVFTCEAFEDDYDTLVSENTTSALPLYLHVTGLKDCVSNGERGPYSGS
jgi:hypothetical protein